MAEISEYSRITPQLEALAAICLSNNQINKEDYVRYNVKRGLRDLDGTGVLAGLTEISEIISSKVVDGKKVPCEGELYYRGYPVEKLTGGFIRDKRFGFEETAYLLMFGQLPTAEQLKAFNEQLAFYRSLPTNFVRDVILKAPSSDMMNTLARCVLTMASYDDKSDDISLANVVRQCIDLIAIFPLISVYAYQAYNHYKNGNSLYIHTPRPDLSTAENILTLLRADSSYSFWEAHVLDICLTLHAEHGGGNNSTFTARVLSSTGTDIYSAISAAIGSLKGPRHGGANHRVMMMMGDLMQNVKDWESDAQVKDYLAKIVRKEVGDHSGLIYGMGHAVYTISDPRAVILKQKARKIAGERGMLREFDLFERVERLAPEVFAGVKGDSKVISANVDFYSGLVYECLGIPSDLYTPLFAVSRIAGWCAHRIEEIETCGRIMRPAYRSLAQQKTYIPLDERG